MTTHCPSCGHTLTFGAGPTTAPDLHEAVARLPWPARDWWKDVVATCSNIRTFCSRDHLDRWTTRHTGQDPGGAVPLERLWALEQPWYGDRLEPTWSPRPRPEAQRLLAEVGLTGEFRKLV